MLTGLLLIAAGLGLLATARAFSRDAGQANDRLLGWLPFPSSWVTQANVALGLILGAAALVTGIVMTAAALT